MRTLRAATLERGYDRALEEWECLVRPASSGPAKFKEASCAVIRKADEISLAVPRRGHVLSTVVELYSDPIRKAVTALSSILGKKHCSAIRASLSLPHGEQSRRDLIRSDGNMAAWAIVSMWVVGVSLRTLPVTTSLLEAIRWFFGPNVPRGLATLPSNEALRKAEKALQTKGDALAYFELLPYILDPHGPGSRLSVRRNPATRTARLRKRAEGVFYTPADVSEYMASACLSALTQESPPSIFDPACGTGVFLRAALRELRHKYPERSISSLAAECLFGTDIDPWPLDATAFVLLADSWIDPRSGGTTPAEAWYRLRLNLACVDTLRIDPAENSTARDKEDDEPVVSSEETRRVSIAQLFPALKEGPTVILGNPPYADLARRSDLAELGLVYQCLGSKAKPSAEIYLPFIEQMIRLTNREECSGALVLPLSIACNVGSQFSLTRELISKTRGRWRFAFFDREPHALFGEDVKTRNAIVLWSRIPSDKTTVLFTGPLRKWRGYNRAAMFRSLEFTVIDGDIRGGIPKIEGNSQSAALRTLNARWSRLEQAVEGIGRVDLADLPSADDRTVFVGATAYNFINVFVKPQRSVLQDSQTLSEHPLHAVRCASRRDAFAVFGILSSHLAYWWWHTHGDGFHVSRRFIAELPFGLEAMTGRVKDELTEHGNELWSAIETKPIISLNRGRTSVAYTPNGHDGMRRKIDEVLADLAGLKDIFVEELQQFTARTVAARLREHHMTEIEEEGA